jgi:hypothetical protein
MFVCDDIHYRTVVCEGKVKLINESSREREGEEIISKSNMHDRKELRVRRHQHPEHSSYRSYRSDTNTPCWTERTSDYRRNRSVQLQPLVGRPSQVLNEPKLVQTF